MQEHIIKIEQGGNKMTQKNLPENRHSFWLATEEATNFPKLQEDIKIDIAIIGGGIAGVLTAYSLHRAGKNVALIDGREFCSGTTGNTTAKLSAQHQLIYEELINRYGNKHAKLFYDANMEGMQYIKEIAAELNIDCGLEEQSAYVYTENPTFNEQFKNEAKAYEELGIRGSLQKTLPFNDDIELAIKMDNQLQFHPTRFIQGVLRELKKHEVPIYEHSLINDIKQNEDQSMQLKTVDNITVTCNHAMFATHFPTFDPDNFYTEMKPEMSYALLYEVDNLLFEGMYINTDSPTRTFRHVTMDNKNYLLVGGESHPIGDDRSTFDRYESIDQFAKKTFGVSNAIYRWSSHDLITKDRIPFIGDLHPDYPNIYTATGFSKWGLANAAIGAKVITDSVLGRGNIYDELFSPQRTIQELQETSSENEDYHTIKSLHLPEKIADLMPEEATVIENDEEQIGVYKDENKTLHYLDLACTHLGCSVKWNNGDKTWDCPCHGSRFNAVGELIEGPALVNLKQK